jgi:hypothetical protein
MFDFAKAKDEFQSKLYALKQPAAFPAPPAIPHDFRPKPAGFVNYPYPVDEPQSQDYVVYVQDQQVFVYTSWQLDYTSSHFIAGRPVSPVSFASFDLSSDVTVQIVYLSGLKHSQTQTVVVRPLAHDIRPQAYPGGCTFTLRSPCQLSIEPAGSRQQPLLLFANPLELPPPAPSDPNLLYFGPGVHEVSSLELRGGQTLYIAGGAVVYLKPLPKSKCTEKGETLGCRTYSAPALVTSGWSENITVRGRGILCARRALEAGQRAGIMGFQEIRKLTVEGVVLREAGNWTANFVHGNGLHIDNVKILGHCTLLNFPGGPA